MLDVAEMTTESNAPSVDPHIVGNAFVQKYYNHLYESPEEVHKFYLENNGKVSSFNGIATYIMCLNGTKTSFW